MEERVGRCYTTEAPMRLKKKIEAYAGPGELLYIDFGFKSMSPSEETGAPVERIHMVFLGTYEEHVTFHDYLLQIGLAPPEEKTRYEGKIVYLDMNDQETW